MVMSRMRPPEVLIYVCGGGAGSRLVMTASSRVPISPRRSRSRNALKDGSNRRWKPIITRGVLRAISLQHARARSRSRSTGFSHSTALPAPTAAVINGTWVSVGVATSTPSTSPADRTSSTLRAMFTPNSVAVCWAASASTSNTITSLARGCRARFRACIRPMRPQPSTAMPTIFGSPEYRSGPRGKKFIAGRGGELPAPHRPRHDVQVIQVESMCRTHRVVPARHQNHVAILHGHGLVQCPVVGVDTLKGEATGAREAVIVGLFELSLPAVVAVVLVRWIAGPVPARREYLDDQEPLGRRARRQHVADVAGVGARAPHLLADIVRPDQPRRQPAFGRRRAHRQLAAGLRLEDHLRARWRIDRKRLALERTPPCADRPEALAIDADGCAPGEQHQTLLPPGALALEPLPGLQIENLEPDIAPARALGSDPVHPSGGGRQVRFDEQ